MEPIGHAPDPVADAVPVRPRDPRAWAKQISTVPFLAGTPLLVTAAVLSPGPAVPLARAETPQRYTQQAERSIDDQLARLTRGRRCWKPAAGRPLPDVLLVRGADIGDGVTHVREVGLAEGFELARAGRVWVLAGCGRRG